MEITVKCQVVSGNNLRLGNNIFLRVVGMSHHFAKMGRIVDKEQVLFGRELTRMLDRRGMNRAELCQSMGEDGFNPPTLSKYCSGQLRISEENVRKILEALEVNPESFEGRRLLRKAKDSVDTKRRMHVPQMEISRRLGYQTLQKLKETIIEAGYQLIAGSGRESFHYDMKVARYDAPWRALAIAVVDGERDRSHETLARLVQLLPMTVVQESSEGLKLEDCVVGFFRTFPDPEVDARLKEQFGDRLCILHGFNLVEELIRLLGPADT
jgi:transcriptional regulator with XRE-family HTH domain